MLSAILTGRHFETALVLLAGAVGIILAVLGFQHIGGYIPCKLCLAQREPWYAAMPVLVIAALSAWRGWPQCVTRGALAIAGLLIFYSMALAAYHSGVEWRWWEGPGDCGATAGNISADVNDLLADLTSKHPPACEDAAGRFLGLSFAGWNVVASLAMGIVALRSAARKQA